MSFFRENLDVVAGIIPDRGKFLITQRPPGAHLGGFWEFPGGKIEKKETDKNALSREIKEELNLEVTVKKEFHKTEFEYPDRTVNIRFFLCEMEENERPEAVECESYKWVTPEDFNHLPFPPADVEVLEKLKSLDPGVFSPPKKNGTSQT